MAVAGVEGSLRALSSYARRRMPLPGAGSGDAGERSGRRPVPSFVHPWKHRLDVEDGGAVECFQRADLEAVS
jgi:hypothetical protein